MEMQLINADFTICKISNMYEVNFNCDYVFLVKTTDELSLVCETNFTPNNAIKREDGWKMLKVMGTLDFSLIGVISKISTILADNLISVFIVSTYNTDYILIKKENIDKSVELLSNEGYKIVI